MDDDLAVARILKEEHAGCKTVFAIFRGQCEGCDKAARHSDSEGVPLCCECDARLTVEAIADFDAELERLPASYWDEARRIALSEAPANEFGTSSSVEAEKK